MAEITLPPDPEGMNKERAACALHAVRAFQDATGTDDITAIGDLIADLMHLCDRMPHRYQHFSIALCQAQSHYNAETTDVTKSDILCEVAKQHGWPVLSVSVRPMSPEGLRGLPTTKEDE